ncbi:MAG TPA: diacylglycerol kinase family protein [Azospirillum sp.]|nr:diacylglycerol kinase family protein [Azospirillum sp.]
MKVAVVLNQSAGTLLGLPLDEAVQTIEAAFRRTGAEVEVHSARAEGCADAIRNAASSDAETVVVGGGDGTILSAVNAVMPTGKTLGVLPLGTMNLLARDLGTPLDLDAAVHAVAQGGVRPMDVAEVNGEVFLNASILGFYPRVVQEREEQRRRHGLRKWPAMALALVKAVHDFPLLDVHLDIGDGPRRVRTPVLAVSNNPYDEGWGPVVRRSVLDSGTLGIYVARHRSKWGLVRLLAGMALGTWQQDGELETLHATTLTVDSRRRHLRVANDGEVRRLTPPLVYRIRPKALKMLYPRPPEP